jgi:hypothetical protein
LRQDADERVRETPHQRSVIEAGLEQCLIERLLEEGITFLTQPDILRRQHVDESGNGRAPIGAFLAGQESVKAFSGRGRRRLFRRVHDQLPAPADRELIVAWPAGRPIRAALPMLGGSLAGKLSLKAWSSWS